MSKEKDRKDAANAQHELLGFGKERAPYERTKHPEAQWFHHAGLGLFLHWGISAVHGGIDISWAMMAGTPWDSFVEGKNKVTPREYFALADDFQPDRYDPDKWIEAAAKAGYQYAVLTTRHHDGYALWPSKFGNFGTKTHMGGRDLVRPYVEACRKYGLKVGLYFSPPDWHLNHEYMSFHYGSQETFGQVKREEYRTREHYGLDHQPVELKVETEEWRAEYYAYVKGQVEELLTDYGRIDLLWFDGGPPAITMERIRELQPWIVVNPRMHGYGDFITPECTVLESKPEEDWWELCEIWNRGSWGYSKPEGYNTTHWMINKLVDTVSWGGNLLLNSAPRPDGAMPDSYYERLAELKVWMDVNKESVIGVGAGDYPHTSDVRYTVRDNIRYMFFPDADVKEAWLALPSEPVEVIYTGNGQKLDYSYADGKLSLALPDDIRVGPVDVVKVVL